MNATIQLYHTQQDTYTNIDPDVEKELEVWDDYEDTGNSPDICRKLVDETDRGDLWEETTDVHNNKYYAIDVETDEPVTLYILTNESIHSPDWSEPVEGGLTYHPEDDYEPFGCKLSGEVQMFLVRATE